MTKRSQAQREAWARLMDLPTQEQQAKPKKRMPTWCERCKVCADQMYGGPRCLEHNPYPIDDRPLTRAAEESRR